ncbi:NAD(P)-dependent alcohol dehydrogenase [Micromonospora sp. KC606]|uniref:NAD(P)-dependent alcohol dehydrogenase n=1 Tax=Micromonospora sp. KC606 TaxID=2530379 RepID=UPI00104EB4B1|nr:NAD(P)-dependent alcohol dehydrogenase [Micromonospora sp. KC606]TDC82650.1 NAD(P)-dependent alcohol dehydrogenase [Micromonospora sp. KC606]
MKAIVQDRYGSPDVLHLREIDTPEPTGAEILVRVHAAAVNAYDWHVMRGDPYIMRPQLGFGGPRMKVRGRDFAGRVEAVGRDVTRFRPGDEVYGDLGDANGAFAEYACVPHTVVEPKPVNLTFEQAAAMPLAANTALTCLRDAARLQPGQHVLINGASGGVGTFAIQIAKAHGAEVSGVCSTRNVDLVRSTGADHVIDYSREDFTHHTRRYDVVFDLVGNRSLAEFRRALDPTGTLILSGGGVSGGGSLLGPVGLIIRGKMLSRLIRQRLVVPTANPSQENLAALRELAESGKVTPVIDRTYPLSQTADAIRYVEMEHARAKVVIAV